MRLSDSRQWSASNLRFSWGKVRALRALVFLRDSREGSDSRFSRILSSTPVGFEHVLWDEDIEFAKGGKF